MTDFVIRNHFKLEIILIKNKCKVIIMKRKPACTLTCAVPAPRIMSAQIKELNDLTTVNIVGSERGGKTTQDLRRFTGNS